MGQTSSAEESRMKKRVNQAIGSYQDFANHLIEANEWAKLCPTPKTCCLEFRVIVNPRTPPEFLPYVWKVADNIQIEVRKVRREEASIMNPDQTIPISQSTSTIGTAKILQVHQFYFIYCLLSDIRDCAAHSLCSPMCFDKETKSNKDEMECQICMDRQKEVVLPCTHSFCLGCYKSWSSQNKTCPCCRSTIKCEEGEELWQLTFNEATDIQAYANDVVARIYEFLEKMGASQYTEEDISRSNYDFAAAAVALKQRITNRFHQFATSTDTTPSNPLDPDYLYALSLAQHEEDQYEVERSINLLCQDRLLAEALSMEVEE